MRSRRSKGFVLSGLPVLLLVFAGFGDTQPQSRVFVLAELFTSEGCNSCPPADRLLEMLLEEQPLEGTYVVALSEHVTYWDHQGWKDPFGSPQFTTRQQQYGLRFNLDGIYTPQLVIDGTREFVGSDKQSIERALRELAKSTKPALMVSAIETAAAITVSASGPGLQVESDGEVWFAITEDHLSIDVARGENANKTLKHSGVVRVLRNAGNADRVVPIEIQLSPDWRHDNLRVVSFVQSRKNRKVLSVGVKQLGTH
jgi:hypothetical protein